MEKKKIKTKRLVWMIILVIILVLSMPVIYTASLNSAIRNDNVSAVRFLLVFPGNLNRTNDYLDYTGDLPLANACARGNPEIVKMLVEKGAHTEVKGRYNPLIMACRSYSPQKFEVVKILVEAGADVNAFDGFDTSLTALLIKPDSNSSEGAEAAYSIQLETMKYLVDNGTRIDFEYTKNRLLHKAVLVRNLKAVEYLVMSGELDIDILSNHGVTALMYAAEEGQLDIVKYLLEQGADPTIKNSWNKTASTFARENGYEGIAKLIEKYAEQQETGESQ